MSDGVRAGKAYVELGVKNNLMRGLAQAESTLKSWGATVSAAGAIAVGAATTGLGVFASMAKKFADAGSEVDDLSQRTGVSAESLSAMKYAAEQSGTSLQTVAKSMGVMNKLTAQLASGNSGAAKTMEQLGIDTKAFLAASPEERFGMIADALNGIQDEGVRAGMAMKVLGKGGAELLPMLAGGSSGIKTLTDRARELGLVITEEDAKKAAELGDAWDEAGSVFGSLSIKIGAAVSGTFKAALDIGTELIVMAGNWIVANQGLVVAIMAGVAAVGLIGAGLVAFGVAMTAAGVAIGGIVAVFGMLTAAVSFLLSPMGIFLALIAGGIAYLLIFTEEGQWLCSTLSTGFTDLFGIFKSTFGGIVDALSAGQLELAGQIAMAGFNAAMLKGYQIFQSIWSGFKDWLVDIMVKAFTAAIDVIAQALKTISKLVSKTGVVKDFGVEIDALTSIAKFAVPKAAKAYREQNNAAVEAAKADAEMARKQLSDLTEAAAVAKEESKKAKEREAGDKYQASAMGLGGSAVVSGAFLASAASLLGNSPASIAQQQLAATKTGNEKLDEIKERLENMGLEYGS